MKANKLAVARAVVMIALALTSATRGMAADKDALGSGHIKHVLLLSCTNRKS
jgi:hypothetical protein